MVWEEITEVNAEMKTVRVSETNHAKLKLLLLQLIAAQRNPALTMDDAVTELFERANRFKKGFHDVEQFYPENEETSQK